MRSRKKMRINDGMALELYRRMGLENTTRQIPFSLYRHAVRKMVHKKRTLSQVCELERQVTGVRTHYSTVIHSLSVDDELLDDAMAEVVMVIGDLLREKGY
jgi:hypothetical protein